MNEELYRKILSSLVELLKDDYASIANTKAILMNEHNFKDMDIRETIWRGASEGYLEFSAVGWDIKKGPNDAST